MKTIQTQEHLEQIIRYIKHEKWVIPKMKLEQEEVKQLLKDRQETQEREVLVL